MYDNAIGVTSNNPILTGKKGNSLCPNHNNSRRKFISNTANGRGGPDLTAASWNNVMGANHRVRLGVIGTGNRGSDVMGVFQKEPDVEVVALCDCYDQHLNAALEKTEGKAKTFTDYRALLASKEVDAVLIATPDHWHSRMAIDALNAGKDIYVEKPLTFTIERRARHHQSRQGQQPRVRRSACNSAAASITRKPRANTWTRTNSARSRWSAPGGTATATTCARRQLHRTSRPDLDWKRVSWARPSAATSIAQQFYNWRAYLDFGGGQITDLFTHWIDVVHCSWAKICRSRRRPPAAFIAYKDGRTAPDTISVQLEYPSKWIATFDATLVPGARGAALELMGTKGRLYIDRGGYTYQETPAGAEPLRRRRSSAGTPIARTTARPQLPRLREVARSCPTPTSSAVIVRRWPRTWARSPICKSAASRSTRPAKKITSWPPASQAKK